MTQKISNFDKYAWVFLCLCALTIFTACGTTTFYIVRHAEKVSQTDSTHLTADGFNRAKILCDSLVQNPPQQIFSTDRNRTRETAAPTSAFTHFPVSLYSNDTMLQFIQRLIKIKSRSVLIVGHSESVGNIVNGLMEEKVMGAIPENNFDSLIIVTRTHGNRPAKSIIHKNYGPPSPAR